MKIKLDELVNATGGRVLSRHRSEFDSFGIDSRLIKPGSLFFAMKGETTDGHLFVLGAVERGAAGAVVEHPVEVGSHQPTLVQVDDTLKALHATASWARSNSGSHFIGITGSSGKTSTKEFTATLLSEKFGVFKNEGNLNSLTGLPLSVLSMQPADCAVFELAMNHPGEISQLSRILQPHVGVVLNVNPVHIGQFSSIEEIADEKSSLVAGMSEEAVLIFNADDPRLFKRLGGRQNSMSYGFAESSHMRLTDVLLRGVRGIAAVLKWQGSEIRFESNLCGLGNLYNVAAAACVAIALGLTPEQIRSGIGKLEPYKQRGILTEVNGLSLYDDSYNSNPKALELALDLLLKSEGYGRKIAVLGDMLELGSEEKQYHAQAGKQVAAAGVDVLIAVGSLSKTMAEEAERAGVNEVFWMHNSDEAANKLSEIAHPGDLVLVKGSRGIKMETVVNTLSQRAREKT